MWMGSGDRPRTRAQAPGASSGLLARDRRARCGLLPGLVLWLKRRPSEAPRLPASQAPWAGLPGTRPGGASREDPAGMPAAYVSGQGTRGATQVLTVACFPASAGPVPGASPPPTGHLCPPRRAGWGPWDRESADQLFPIGDTWKGQWGAAMWPRLPGTPPHLCRPVTAEPGAPGSLLPGV